MNKILAKLGFPHAFGVYCDGKAVYVSEAVATPFGSRAMAQLVIPMLEGEAQTDAYARGLDRLGSSSSGVALGVPCERAYLATRPMSSASTSASPKVLLRESLRSASVSVESMVADMATFRPDRRDVVSIAACQRSELAAFDALLRKRRMRMLRSEPAPCALLRIAKSQGQTNQKGKVFVRVFLNATHAMAVLTSNERPIVWRTVELAAGDEAAGILTLVRALATIGQPCGIERSIEAVVIHGRSDVQRLVDTDWIRHELGVPFHWLAGPENDGSEIAKGLALGGIDENNDDAFNLGSEFFQLAKFYQVFPWREVVLYAAVLFAMAGFMIREKTKMQMSRDDAIAANSQSPLAGLSKADLQKQKKQLSDQVASVERFLKSRISWTTISRELTESLPESVYLTSFSGEAEMEKLKKGKAGVKRSLTIQGAVTLPQSGLIPHEIDILLDTIRHHPLIKEQFSDVELADLKQFRQLDDEDLAMFTVLCLPKSAKKKK